MNSFVDRKVWSDKVDFLLEWIELIWLEYWVDK